MKLNNANVKQTIKDATKMLEKEKNISPAFRAVIQLLLAFVQLMVDRLGLNSKNSSKPPSTDQKNAKEKKKRKKSTRKPGGQKGRQGVQLKPVEDPDVVENISIDRRGLPKGKYVEDGYESRQVIDFEVSLIITEYRAQVLTDTLGNRFVAPFPDFVTRPVQYGPNIKSTAVYMSQFQMIPYNRIVDYFSDQAGFNISPGSLYNFNKEAYDKLEEFETIVKEKLISSSVVNADETGINVNGKRIWLHTACNEKWTHFFPHEKRGTEAMNAIGILPKVNGVLCHDYWKAYFTYTCKHSLCCAHLIRELEWSSSEDKQKWAGSVKKFLTKLNKKVNDSGGQLPLERCSYYLKKYKKMLSDAEQECPKPNIKRKKGQRGQIKKSKSRNLLERLIKNEAEVLRFMYEKDVPFTNNQGENDLRMTKVQQKISGCFRSIEGAMIFCRIRSYLITCRKHGMDPTEALSFLYKGMLPDFLKPG